MQRSGDSKVLLRNRKWEGSIEGCNGVSPVSQQEEETVEKL